MKKLKKYFLTGIVIIIPVSLTVYVLVSIFNFLDNILGRFLTGYFRNKLGFYMPGLGFLISVLVIVLAGFLATKFFRHKFFVSLEKWFAGLPLIKNIYPALKQIILFISAEKEFGFKKVVMVEYPSRGIWTIGFLTNEQFDKINKITGKEMASLFVPTSPGPLTGNVIFVPKEEIKFSDMSIKAALNIIISGGVFKSED